MHMNFNNIQFLIRRVFAHPFAHTLLGRLSTRFRNVFMRLFYHFSRSVLGQDTPVKEVLISVSLLSWLNKGF